MSTIYIMEITNFHNDGRLMERGHIMEIMYMCISLFPLICHYLCYANSCPEFTLQKSFRYVCPSLHKFALIYIIEIHVHTLYYGILCP